jgi:GH35 family endo-1,4-beta-xylanase
VSLRTTEFVSNRKMVIVPHPLYWPHLTPLWFRCFPN